MINYTNNVKVDVVVNELFARHESELYAIRQFFKNRVATEPGYDPFKFDEKTNAFFSDKVMALDPDKSQYCYNLCRALKPKIVVEAGTSYGLSTLFLAAAIKENSEGKEEKGIIHCSELSPAKVKKAKEYFSRAEVDDVINLRTGDILSTLKDIEGPIDLVLLDIGKPVPTELIKLLYDRLKPGCVILSDEPEQRYNYGDFFDYINSPENNFSTMTLPFSGGLEFTVKL